MNLQKPEPRREGDGSILDLHSMFFTIQGEGPYAGHRSIFVRLAGCNLQCPGCDTEYTDGRELTPVGEIVKAIDKLAKEHNAAECLIVITGGEPLRQNLSRLLERLLLRNYSIQIESNGVFEPSPGAAAFIRAGRVDLVVSPKTSRINFETAKLATCFKYVLDHRSINPVDGLPFFAPEHPAKTGVARPLPGVPVYVNPYDAQDPVANEQNLFAASQSAMQHGYILGVQIHKLAGLA